MSKQQSKFLAKAKIDVPSVAELGALYQRAMAKDDRMIALSAEQAVLALGRGEAALAEARNMAAFLDAV
jgi:hypothetical protein